MLQDILPFVLDESNESILVYNSRLEIIYQNKRAKQFLGGYELPEEIPSLLKRIFLAIALKNTPEMFPGQICFSREIGERLWIFRIIFCETPKPFVCIFFADKKVSSWLDLNALRQQYKLTRRETDVLRYLLDGIKNREISMELGVIEQTVKDYLSSIYSKIGVQDRFALLRHLLYTSQQ